MEQNLCNVRPMSVVAQEAINYIAGRREHNIVSLKTRWNKFNRQCMGGIEPNTVYTIAGISGSGNKIFVICNQTDTIYIVNYLYKDSLISLGRKYNKYKEYCRLYLEEYKLKLGKYGELWEENTVVNSEIAKGSESPYSVDFE